MPYLLIYNFALIKMACILVHKYILDIITCDWIFETPFFPVFINIYFLWIAHP